MLRRLASRITVGSGAVAHSLAVPEVLVRKEGYIFSGEDANQCLMNHKSVDLFISSIPVRRVA